MNNIDRCKKAQEFGLRVQLLKNDGWRTHENVFILHESCYRVHPEDEKAFANFLALSQVVDSTKADNKLLTDRVNNTLTDRVNNTLIERNKWADAHVRVSEELRTEREQHAAQRQRDLQTIQDQVGMINVLRSRVNVAKAPATEDLLQQLRQKLGANTIITITATGL